MSHVISAQPSATSPYQPTALQEGNGGDNPPRVHRIDSEQHDDCCIHTRNKKGCCLFVCTLLSMCCQGIQNCTERCCDCCANCLNDCCEDKPRERNQRIYHKRYTKSGGSYYDNTADNDDWGINSVEIGSNFSEPAQNLMSNSNDNDYSTSRGADPVTHHSKTHHEPVTHHSGNHHDSGIHHSNNYHDSGTHHTSSHDTSTCHTSSHDTGGGGDSGGGCDSGGGDTGGGGDSGGGGGGCDD